MAAKASSKTPSAGLDKRTADLESAIAAITKSFGEGSIMRLGAEGANLKTPPKATGPAFQMPWHPTKQSHYSSTLSNNWSGITRR